MRMDVVGAIAGLGVHECGHEETAVGVQSQARWLSPEMRAKTPMGMSRCVPGLRRSLGARRSSSSHSSRRRRVRATGTCDTCAWPCRPRTPVDSHPRQSCRVRVTRVTRGS